MTNPLFDDQTIDFILHDVLAVDELLKLPRYGAHSPQTLRMSVDAARRFAREALFPTYKPMDEAPARFSDGKVHTHALMGPLYRQIADAGFIAATRPFEVGGQQLPAVIGTAMLAYLQAGNPAAYGFASLTAGAAHLIETFGTDEQKQLYMQPMYEGRWTGTMCLTEPQAGSSLADVRTRATPQPDGSYLMQGGKVFISGGENTFSENVVHLVLARVDGAPAGIKGVSLFVVPKLRPEGGKLVDNDVRASGTFHKLGWRGLPSIALQLGDEGRCRGWLVGAVNQGLRCMFQMMNEARVIVGICATATASVGYQEALSYARTRPQGRALSNRDAQSPQVPIIEHADVRRMLLAQKATVEGCAALLLTTSWLLDLAEASVEAEERAAAMRLVDLLTPIAKTWPSEKGFEANVLSVQVLGGYGYTSEFLPEALLRDQKLNTIHEGTTGIQSLDLLGRKIFMDGGASLAALAGRMQRDISRGRERERTRTMADALATSMERWTEVLAALGGRAPPGRLDDAMRHSVAHLELASIVVTAWMWLRMAASALDGNGGRGELFYEGKLRCADYWFAHELPKVAHLAGLISGSDESFATMPLDAF